MYKVETLYLSPDYDEGLVERNRDMVGFVVEKGTSKVKGVSVITRDSLGSWFHAKRAEYPEDKFDLVLASLSVLGTLRGADVKDADEKPAKRDPLLYRVN